MSQDGLERGELAKGVSLGLHFAQGVDGTLKWSLCYRVYVEEVVQAREGCSSDNILK